MNLLKELAIAHEIALNYYAIPDLEDLDEGVDEIVGNLMHCDDEAVVLTILDKYTGWSPSNIIESLLIEVFDQNEVKHEEEASKNYDKRKQWFINRIGKTVYRTNSCECKSCLSVQENGLTISDKDHATYLLDNEGIANDSGFQLRYFDTKEEVVHLKHQMTVNKKEKELKNALDEAITRLEWWNKSYPKESSKVDLGRIKKWKKLI